MKNILIIDDENQVRDVINITLTENGYKAYEAENGKKGVELFMNRNPDIVITDVNMPEMSGIEVTKKIKELKADTDVVIMTGFGTEELVVDALRSGASNYIKKPIDLKELLSILDNIILKRENRKRFEVLKDIVVKESKILILGNNISNLWGTVNQALFNVPNSLSEGSLEGLKLGLYEILLNAIEHGNLGITYDEKKEALNRNIYNEVIDKRLREANKQGKVVNVQCNYSTEELTIEITDQGEGFNYDILPLLTDPDTILSAHGRGIILASLYYDNIEYKKPGNRVILTKRFR
jgi:YesN/AraC family two-component response regulator